MPGGADDPDEVLPEGWKKWYSERRKRYYFHQEATGKVWVGVRARVWLGSRQPAASRFHRSHQ